VKGQKCDDITPFAGIELHIFSATRKSYNIFSDSKNKSTNISDPKGSVS